MIRLVSQNKPFFSDNFEEKLLQIRTMGFDGFEADGSMLLNGADEMLRAAEKTGVPVTSVCGGYRGWIGDFDQEKREHALADIEQILIVSEKLDAKGIVVPAAWGMYSLRLPPLTRRRPAEEDEAVLLDSLSRLDKICDKTGRMILLEPLNRYEDHMLNTQSDAIALIEKGGFKHVGLTADFYHMNIEECSIPGSLIENAKYIAHIHIGDSHRYQPGSGHLDFVSGFKALREIGYDGYFAFEHRILGEDQEAGYKDGLMYIRKCMREAGL